MINLTANDLAAIGKVAPGSSPITPVLRNELPKLSPEVKQRVEEAVARKEVYR